MANVQGTLKSPGAAPRGASQRKPWPNQRAGRTYPLKRFNYAPRPSYGSRALQFIGGSILPRLAGAAAIFLSPSRMADGSYGDLGRLHDSVLSNERAARLFDRVETQTGNIYLPRGSYARDFETGNFSLPPMISAVPTHPPGLPAARVDPNGQPYRAADPDETGLPRPVTTDWGVAELSKIWGYSDRIYKDFVRRQKAKVPVITQMAYLNASARDLVHVRAPYVRQGFVAEPPPNASLYYKWQYNYQTQRFEQYFDDHGYRIAYSMWQSRVRFQEQLHQQRQDDLYYQRERERQEDIRRNEEIRRYNQELARVQALTRVNNANWDFVISQQPMTSVNFNAKRKRRNDTKTDFGYAYALSIINRTYGEFDEAADLWTAFYNNLDPVGKASGWDWYTYKVPAVFGKPAHYDVRPRDWRKALTMFMDGRAQLDWSGFFTDVVKNQIEDYLYGAVGRGQREYAQLTKRPVGLNFGPAL